MHSQRLVIIGGGIAGLAAAWEASAHSAVQVTVVDDHLAGPGGKLRTSPVAGVATDEGADMFLTRVPEGLALADELGLGDRLRAPSAGGAAIWMDGAAHPMPTGLVLGVPVDPSSLEGSALVDPSDVEAVRAELNRTGPPVVEDCSIGALVRERFGDRIAQRLVQPLLGGINAGVIDRLSLAAVAPQLDAAARSGPSLAAALAETRPQAASVNGGAGAGAGVPVPGGSNPPFRALPGGMGELVEVLRTRLVERGVTLLDGVTARSGRRADGALVVDCEGRSLDADAVVAAVPAAAAANLLRGGPGA
ncbi:MAG: FAD-dependent oxidoreductase, partial [Microthrixaceae bacterium]|nr:FAD-dependent oxidoreductase [Microthrixaceae bacterium]